MRSRTCFGLLSSLICLLGCESESAPSSIQSDASDAGDAGMHASDASEQDADSAAIDASACDLSGVWVTQHVTTNTALGATQLATNWNYHRIEQDGTRLRIVESLDCGYVVRGTTDVSLGDATLEAMAVHATNAVGVEGTLELADDGSGCALAMDRIYTIRGADRARYLDAIWEIGDAPKELSEFELPANEAEGMEDWDEDGHEAITQLTGFGDRYTAQIDWHAFRGTLPLEEGQLGDAIGGDGIIFADYDAIESVSDETLEILSTSSVPMSPGAGFLLRADDLEIVTSGEHPELETCKNVQAMAVAQLGSPPRP